MPKVNNFNLNLCGFLNNTVLLCLVAQWCPRLCNPMNYCPPGSSVHGILQTRTLGWVAMPSSRGSSQPRDWSQVSYIAGRFFTIELPGKPTHYDNLNNTMSWLGEGNGNQLQYSCLENFMDRGAWQFKGSKRVGYDWAANIHFFILHFTVFSTLGLSQKAEKQFHYLFYKSISSMLQTEYYFTQYQVRLQASPLSFPKCSSQG